MANHWFHLLVGLILAQGLLSLSPVPVPEEEWEEFSRMLRDPNYRLIRTTIPSSYEVTIEPYFDNPPENIEPFTFDGSVVINITPTQENVDEIVMHCQDLVIESLTVEHTNNGVTRVISEENRNYECEMPYAFLKIPLTESLQTSEGHSYVVRSTYRGLIHNDMRGFYRSWYRDSTGLKWMGTTQFQPGHARKAFPCYDEPSFKATFVFNIIREPDFSPTISNMPMASSRVENGKVVETFHRTPITSTYLLAFIISHYKLVSGNDNTERPFDIYARDNIGSQGDWALEVGEQLLEYFEGYTNIPYYTMAENMNMKQAAIPDFSAGAMENWGLLTYREALLLYDPENTNHFYRHRVANIVAHEIAHMWFGNLVTCAWWDNLWLNEGFARFYQYYMTHAVREELGFDTRFITEQLQTSLLSDSVNSAHPLTDPSVNDPTAVSAFFSTISYAKGASILRMTQHLLGEDTYVKGLRAYLVARQYDVAEPQHLFDELDAAAAEDGALSAYNGLTISSYFRTWSEQAGHPLLTVTINQETGEMTVRQARWNRDTGVSTIQNIYTVPITWTRAGSPDFNNLKPTTIMLTESTVIQRGSTGPEWVIFNKQQSGFYRVNYDDTNWNLITQALRGSDRTVIHEYNRAHIVDDLFNLARAGVQPYDKVFNVLSFLEFEDQYAPWLAAITGFNFLRRRLAQDYNQLQQLENEIIRLSTALTQRLGYADRDTDTFMDGLLRMNVMEFLCDVRHRECIDAGRTYFLNWRNGGYIPPNMRPWVYCTGLRYGSAADFDYFWQRYLQTDLANEQVVMLQKAGCTTHEGSLYKFLDAITDRNFTVRSQDFTTALNSAVSGNEINTMRVFEWLKNNVDRATDALGSTSTLLSYITARLLNEEQMRQVQTWLDANRDLIGTASYNTGINGINSARTNLDWSAERIPELLQYLENGFQADTPATENEEDPSPDSANIAALGVLTLLATLVVNLVA